MGARKYGNHGRRRTICETPPLTVDTTHKFGNVLRFGEKRLEDDGERVLLGHNSCKACTH